MGMKISENEQGSEAWLKDRLGMPTGSQIKNIVTPTGKPVSGKARDTYMRDLVGERLNGYAKYIPESRAMKRGTALEPVARRRYEDDTGFSVEEVGFIIADGGRWGASLDGRVDEGCGNLEIKCPEANRAIECFLGEDAHKDYEVQCQFGLFVCEVDWCHLYVYTDEMNEAREIFIIEPDEAIQDCFREELPRFCDELDEMTERIRELGGRQ